MSSKTEDWGEKDTEEETLPGKSWKDAEADDGAGGLAG